MTKRPRPKQPAASATVRDDSDPPAAIARWGWRFHHVGIPTTTVRPGEIHLRALGMHVSGFSTSPFGVEWMRFDADSPVSELIRRVPHVAFEVDDLDAAIRGRALLGEVSSPSAGVRVAMILDNGTPIELLEFRSKWNPVRSKVRRPVRETSNHPRK